MNTKSAIGLGWIMAAVGLIVPACSSSSSGSSAVDSGGGGSDSAAGDSTTGGGDTGAASDTGSSADTSAPSDSGTVSDSHDSDVIDAPYCATVQALLDAGTINQASATCLDWCCTDLTTCVQTAGCPMAFKCLTDCIHQSDAGAAACASTCEADASSQVSTDVNQLGTCVKQHGC
jgi:hypothetical protein